MKTFLVSICIIGAVLAVPMAEARGRSSGYSYTPAKLYSCAGCNSSDHYVSPTVRSNGVYVQGHMKTDSNSTRSDNFTQTGNINPYTGVLGNKD
jgi:hypothetical protein